MLTPGIRSGAEPTRFALSWLPHLVATAGLFAVEPAWADSIIKEPGNHPDYFVELEPHGLFGAFEPPGDSRGTGWGVGLRLTIPVAPDGFISSINDSVGVGFGLDWVRYHDDTVVGFCTEYGLTAPDGTRICTEVSESGGNANYFYFPVVMQWNFWLLEALSVFGEPGLTFYYQTQEHDPDGDFSLVPALHAGMRWHFTERASLTVRLGYPVLSLGVSFFL